MTGLRAGWASEPTFGPVDREVTATVMAAADALQDLGCAVEPTSLDVDGTALSAVLFAAEVAPYFRRTVAGRMIAAREVTTTDYVDALQQVDALSSLFAGYFEHYDALLCPVCPSPDAASEAGPAGRGARSRTRCGSRSPG